MMKYITINGKIEKREEDDDESKDFEVNKILLKKQFISFNCENRLCL